MVRSVKELLLVPIRKPASCGAGEVLTPSNEAVRVAPDALSLKEETAVMFPSPEVPPPDGFQSVVYVKVKLTSSILQFPEEFVATKRTAK